jgi:NitT/TauT family transport system ATP-binding protein
MVQIGAPAQGAAVSFRNVTKSFVSRTDNVVCALQDVSFDVAPGEFVAIVGPSGCGKSTTLNILAGLTAPNRGSATIRGRSVADARLEIGYVFQQDTVLPWMRVRENVEIGLGIRNIGRAARRERADALLQQIGLTGFEEAYPHELSGGMRKRVALASTMAYHPSILLMDEPFGALDAQTRVLMQDELLRVWEAQRSTVLFVTHDLPEAISLADRVIVMTARPARIKTQYIVDLPRPRTAADARFHPNFDALHMRIWTDLRPELSVQAKQDDA